MGKIKVKICGITNLEDAKQAVDLGADILGFVFARSPRQITPQKAKAIIKNLPPFVIRVGVFVNEKLENIEKIVNFCRLNLVQLHGEESPDFCKKVRKFVGVIKAFRMRSALELKKMLNYDVDAYLLDSFVTGVYGGTGKTFDWGLAIKAKRILNKRPLILSGGLNPENIAQAIKKVRPYAVDTSSGVEKFPGKKDKVLLKRYFRKLFLP
ncbi:MAG: phosphoribosylanthranilate isomerase [Candidatus Omnitrophica bacterium]|nr:phosphoribosylanthranilate isomerase [Candidatus Omnitrophota bacterium]